MSQLFTLAAWISYAVFFIAPLVQTSRIIKRKSSEDISLAYLALLIFAMLILVPQMLATHTPSLYVGHIAALCANTLTLIVSIYYRKKPGQLS